MHGGACGLRPVALVDVVVGLAAEGVQREGRPGHPRWEQEGCDEERLGALLHDAFAVGTVLVPVLIKCTDLFHFSLEFSVRVLVEEDHATQRAQRRKAYHRVEEKVYKERSRDHELRVSRLEIYVYRVAYNCLHQRKHDPAHESVARDPSELHPACHPAGHSLFHAVEPTRCRIHRSQTTRMRP
jgi:hypothetical protein